MLIGHSMGGFMAVQGAASDPAIRAFATISAADLGDRMRSALAHRNEHDALARVGDALADSGMAPLAGCTPESLAHQMLDHADDWAFLSRVDALKDRNVLVVTSDDGLAESNRAFADALRKAGDTHVRTMHLATDHAYSDRRLELSKAVLAWLAGLPE